MADQTLLDRCYRGREGACANLPARAADGVWYCTGAETDDRAQDSGKLRGCDDENRYLCDAHAYATAENRAGLARSNHMTSGLIRCADHALPGDVNMLTGYAASGGPSGEDGRGEATREPALPLWALVDLYAGGTTAPPGREGGSPEPDTCGGAEW